MGGNVIAIPLTNLLHQKPLTQSMEALRMKKIYQDEIVVVDGAHPPKAQYSYKEEQSLEDVFSGIHDDNWELGRIRQVIESVQLVPKMKNEIKDWVWTILNAW